MFQKTYAGKILACHMQLLNAIRSGDYLPDRVVNLVLQYLTNRCVLMLMIRHFVLVKWSFVMLASHTIFIFFCLVSNEILINLANDFSHTQILCGIVAASDFLCVASGPRYPGATVAKDVSRCHCDQG